MFICFICDSSIMPFSGNIGPQNRYDNFCVFLFYLAWKLITSIKRNQTNFYSLNYYLTTILIQYKVEHM